MRLVWMGVAVLLFVAEAGAQLRLEFDAASVKPNRSGETGSMNNGVGRSILSGQLGVTREHISLVNTALRAVIELAYGIAVTQRYALTGGAEKLLAERYDIAAAVPDGATSGQVMEMFQSLLADRFKLRIHKEARQTPVYVVMVARSGQLGPQLWPSAIDCVTYHRPAPGEPEVAEPVARDGKLLCRRSDSPAGGLMTSGSASQIPSLLIRYQGFFDRPLIDATGLTGSFEWKLSFDMRTDTPNATGPFIRDAFEDQLGLKVEPRTAAVDVWVIDGIEPAMPD